MITTGTTPGATRFITGTTTIEAETPASETANPTVPAQRPGLLKETIKQVEDTLNPAVRAVRARAPSAVTTTVERQGAIHHAEVPASAAEEGHAAAAAGIDSRSFVGFLIHREI
jgi:hypothetical protein